MSCNHHDNHYLCDVVKEILEVQSSKKDCMDQQCGCLIPLGVKDNFNTIPFMLICRGDCDLFIGTGIFHDPICLAFNSIKTPFFRVSKFIDDKDDKSCFVQLELLQAQTEKGTVPSFSKEDHCKGISKFIRTGICMTIDLNCFCGIECLPPVNAKCEVPICKPVKDTIIQEELCGNFSEGNVTVWQAPLGDYFEGTFEIYNDNSSLGNIHANITASPQIISPSIPPGFTVSRSANKPSAFTINAPSSTSGRYCITLFKRIDC